MEYNSRITRRYISNPSRGSRIVCNAVQEVHEILTFLIGQIDLGPDSSLFGELVTCRFVFSSSLDELIDALSPIFNIDVARYCGLIREGSIDICQFVSEAFNFMLVSNQTLS